MSSVPRKGSSAPASPRAVVCSLARFKNSQTGSRKRGLMLKDIQFPKTPLSTSFLASLPPPFGNYITPAPTTHSLYSGSLAIAGGYSALEDITSTTPSFLEYMHLVFRGLEGLQEQQLMSCILPSFSTASSTFKIQTRAPDVVYVSCVTERVGETVSNMILAKLKTPRPPSGSSLRKELRRQPLTARSRLP